MAQKTEGASANFCAEGLNSCVTPNMIKHIKTIGHKHRADEFQVPELKRQPMMSQAMINSLDKNVKIFRQQAGNHPSLVEALSDHPRGLFVLPMPGQSQEAILPMLGFQAYQVFDSFQQESAFGEHTYILQHTFGSHKPETYCEEPSSNLSFEMNSVYSA